MAREKIHSNHTEQKIKNNFKNSGVGISEVCYDLELDLQLLQQIVEDVYIYKCMFTHTKTQYTHRHTHGHTYTSTYTNIRTCACTGTDDTHKHTDVCVHIS